MELLGDVNVTTGDGYQFLTPHIAINLADAIWYAKSGVRMMGKTARCARQGLRLTKTRPFTVSRIFACGFCRANKSAVK